MTHDDRLAEIAVMTALLLPADMPQATTTRLAAGLRRIVMLLPASDQSPASRAMRRDLLAAAEALDQTT